ncbi:hypothetical protein SAMN05421812_114239 [Asanoa hainanensis]|uniref:Uncharacterized protein n=1 Tax=Asanoa hainanensis TaxID=560556 RepID=A0A239P8N1_9ACTN|nr:hypothetical protein [Asanoa hainanensis]SNT62968.1 hypothetical protein SAMN05421812_114239 [Asanoa hainanensis]
MGEPEERDEEPNEPNEFGFAGAATGPEPNLSEDDVSEGEEIAVPAGDITGAIVSAIEGDHGSDSDEDEQSKN